MEERAEDAHDGQYMGPKGALHGVFAPFPTPRSHYSERGNRASTLLSAFACVSTIALGGGSLELLIYWDYQGTKTSRPEVAKVRSEEMGPLLLAIDVGNTNTVVGVFRGDELVADWRLATDSHTMPDEHAVLLSSLLSYQGLSMAEVDAAIIASVVPKVTANLREMIEKYIKVQALVVGPSIETGVRIGIDNPKEVGVDRIVNALAAHRLYGGPAIVIDLGTATTFDAVSAEGEYLGGAIAPGILTSVEALARQTARLPRVDMVRPPHAIGRDTLSAMQSGIILGHAAMVEGMVRRIAAEMGGEPRVIATGGLCGVIAAEVPLIQVADKTLTLKGLRMMYDLNRPRA